MISLLACLDIKSVKLSRLSLKHLASSNLVKFSLSLSISERWSPPLWRHYTANFVVSGRESAEQEDYFATRLRDFHGVVPQFDMADPGSTETTKERAKVCGFMIHLWRQPLAFTSHFNGGKMECRQHLQGFRVK